MTFFSCTQDELILNVWARVPSSTRREVQVKMPQRAQIQQLRNLYEQARQVSSSLPDIDRAEAKHWEFFIVEESALTAGPLWVGGLRIEPEKYRAQMIAVAVGESARFDKCKAGIWRLCHTVLKEKTADMSGIPLGISVH